jgi:hypothetical protein
MKKGLDSREFGVKGVEFRGKGSGFRVWGLGFFRMMKTEVVSRLQG